MTMNKILKPAVLGAILILSLPMIAQGTNEYLKPCDYKGQFSRDNFVCWGTKMVPSFSESYEILCKRNSQTETYRLELMIQNQKEPHILDIDENLAYQIRTLIDAAVYSASNLPDKEWMQQNLDILKSGNGSSIIGIGLDGENHYFCNRSYGAYCWSPSGGNNAALVSIGQAIYNAIAYKDPDRIKSRLNDIKSLTKNYASLLQEPYREYFLLRIDKKPERWWWSEY